MRFKKVLDRGDTSRLFNHRLANGGAKYVSMIARVDGVQIIPSRLHFSKSDLTSKTVTAVPQELMRRPIDLLKYEARICPQVAELLDRIAYVTDEEIDSIKVRLPWVRKALKQVRDQKSKEFKSQEAFDNVEKYIKIIYTPDPPGNTVRWVREETYLTFRGRHGDSQLLIPEGRLLWFPDSGGVWYDTVFSMVPDPRIAAFSIPVARQTKTQYTAMFHEELQRQYAGAFPSTETTSRPCDLGIPGLWITRL